ncbi:MAG TPA: hypothetical protein VJN89_12175 [Candidatus Acidoferrum sp.]|nr:hypothetical protein [Candidatus Acidoferrum sp.]
MKILHVASLIVLCAVVPPGAAFAQQSAALGQNAALRYWSAFAEMQDSAISDQQAKELNLILDGTAPYSDLKYYELVEKNRAAVETMARGTAIPNCDWGVDYALGSDAPVEYVRKALALGRLNVLYAFHLLQNGDKDGAVRALAAGVRFSRDVANGGSLFATLVAKNLLITHIKAMAGALHMGQLSAAQKSVLQRALSQLGEEGLDWQSAVKREFEIPMPGADAKASSALAQISIAFQNAVNNPSALPGLQQMIASSPQKVRELIPNPQRFLDAKQDLADQLRQMRSLLQ